LSKALVIQTAYLGDTVLTTPLITRLAEKYDTVDVVCAPASCALLETRTDIGNTIPFDKRGKDRGVRGLFHLARTLRSLNYDTAYIPHKSLRSALLARVAGIRKRVGFREPMWRFLYTENHPTTAVHETARKHELQGDTKKAPPTKTTLVLVAEDRAVANRYLLSAGIAPGEPFVVLAPGAMWATKRWPYFAELSRLLKGAFPMVSVGTDSEKGVFPSDSGVLNLAGRLTIRESAAIIEMASFVLTNDSAPMHIAGAVDTPVLAIFGPTTPHLGFGPLGKNDDVVELPDLECRPCSTHGNKRCPLRHHRCMKDLEPEVVAARLKTIVTQITEG
jgi:heptosyltransferase-2